MTPVSVRDALAADAEAIARVASVSWSETYRDIFEPAFIAEFLDANYQPAALAGQADRAAGLADGHFLVAERDGDVVAFAQFGVGPRGPELSRIYADPAHFGTGAGSALLEELHRRIAGSVDAYVLEVHSKNERGRAFYDRNGFVIVGDEGRMPGCDLVLRRTLTPVRPVLPVETDRLRLRPLEPADAEPAVRDLRRRRDDAPRRPYRAAGARLAKPRARAVGAICATTSSTGSGCGRSTSARARNWSASLAWRGSRAMAPRSRRPTSCAATAGAVATRPRR